MGLLIGLTGERGAGKSQITNILVARGWLPGHAFGPGKSMTQHMLVYLGLPPEEAYDRVEGLWREEPCPVLPVDPATGLHYSVRFWMEEFGFWMGTHMGADWTLGGEMKHLVSEWVKGSGVSDYDAQNYVMQSMVYEAEFFTKRLGGIIVRVTRPGHESGIVAQRTSSAQAQVKHDFELVNDGTLADLDGKVTALLEEIDLRALEGRVGL